jgi:hypothetical protein
MGHRDHDKPLASELPARGSLSLARLSGARHGAQRQADSGLQLRDQHAARRQGALARACAIEGACQARTRTTDDYLKEREEIDAARAKLKAERGNGEDAHRLRSPPAERARAESGSSRGPRARARPVRA